MASLTEPTEQLVQEPDQGITPRAFLVGLALVVIVCFVATDTTYRLRASRVSLGHVPMSLWLPFTLLFLTNPLLRMFRPSWSLRPQELGLVLCMGFIGAIFPTKNVAGRLVAVLATPYYKASSENRWDDYITEYLPSWAVPSNRYGDITHLWEGLPLHETLPWSVWAGPLFWWFTLFAAVFVACLCITVILRKQWVEHERIVFPLASLPVIMITQTDEESGWPRVLHDRLFWIGFGIAAFILCWNILPLFMHQIPTIRIGPTYRTTVSFGRDFPALQIKFNYVVAAFGYLTNLEVLLSIWLFHVLSLVEIGTLNRFGIIVRSDFENGLTVQQVGGFITLALFALFTARNHIATVLKAAWKNDGTVDDSKELLSYRTAVVSLVLSLAYVFAWMTALGISPIGIIVQLSFLFIYFLGLTKIVAETGLVYIETPLRTQELAAAVLGRTIQTADHVGMALMTNSIESHREYAMPTLAHIGKIQDRFNWARHGLLFAIGSAFVVGFVVSVVYTLDLCYGATGAANIRHVYVFGGYTQLMFDRVVTWAGAMPEFTPAEVSLFSVGVVGTLLLSIVRLRFAWWPLHPVGFTVGYVYPVRVTAFTVFLVWATKSIVLRIGGITLYKRLQPFFIGLLTGYTIGVGISTLVDVIWFPGNGHMVHSW